MFLSQGNIAPVHDNSHHGCCRNFVILCPHFTLVPGYYFLVFYLNIIQL